MLKLLYPYHGDSVLECAEIKKMEYTDNLSSLCIHSNHFTLFHILLVRFDIDVEILMNFRNIHERMLLKGFDKIKNLNIKCQSEL